MYSYSVEIPEEPFITHLISLHCLKANPSSMLKYISLSVVWFPNTDTQWHSRTHRVTHAHTQTYIHVHTLIHTHTRTIAAV